MAKRNIYVSKIKQYLKLYVNLEKKVIINK